MAEEMTEVKLSTLTVWILMEAYLIELPPLYWVQDRVSKTINLY